MAKEPKPKGKIRVFLFELEGSDETLLKSIESIAGAVNRTFPPNGVLTPRQQLAKSKADSNAEAVSLTETDTDIEEFDEDESDNVEVSVTKPKKIRRHKVPEILDNLQLDDGPTTLKDFWDAKNPNKTVTKFAVLATWLKEERNIDEIGANHIYTCGKNVGWTIPNDIGQAFRNGKSLGYFDNGSESGAYAITLKGVNMVAELNKPT